MTAHEIGELILVAWKNHHKRNSFESRDFVVAFIMNMDGIDWKEFAFNGALYRKYWDRKGWNYNSETLLAWVRNGYPGPPPEAEERPAKESKSEEMSRVMKERALKHFTQKGISS